MNYVVIIVLFIQLAAYSAPGEAFICDVDLFGADSDGVILSTKAIQKAIDTCAENGGGTVYFPPYSAYHTAPLTLRSHLIIYLDKGTTLLGTDDLNEVPLTTGRCEGLTCSTYASIFNGDGLKNVTITGPGIIDGNGFVWWKRFKLNRLKYQRPRIICIMNSQDITLTEVTLKNSPFWTVHFVYSSDIFISDVSIHNPTNSPNTDGIDIDSSKNVWIQRTFINVGDDCIAIKSGKGDDGRRINLPSENITVTSSNMQHGHGGVTIGSETSGGIRNVYINNCTFSNTARGIRMKTHRSRGGAVENITYENITMIDVIRGIEIEMNYSRNGPEPDETYPTYFRNITLRNVVSLYRKLKPHLYLVDTVEINCLHDFPCTGFILYNVEMPQAKGYSFLNIDGATLTNVTIGGGSTQKHQVKVHKSTSLLPSAPLGGPGAASNRLVKRGIFSFGWSMFVSEPSSSESSYSNWLWNMVIGGGRSGGSGNGGGNGGGNGLDAPSFVYCRLENVTKLFLIGGIKMDCVNRGSEKTSLIYDFSPWILFLLLTYKSTERLFLEFQRRNWIPNQFIYWTTNTWNSIFNCCWERSMLNTSKTK